MMNMPPVTKNLIIINLLFFLAKLVAVRYGVDLDNLLGLHFFLAPDFNFYQSLRICSCMVRHAYSFLICSPCGCSVG